MRKISILYLLLMWCGFVCAQESFGCWGSQDERAQSSMGETIVVCNESSPLNEKVVLIRIETGVPGKQKTYKIVME